MKRIVFITFAAISMLFVSCMSVNTRESQYPKMYSEHPTTILVMPPINNTTNVEAKDLLYTSISYPLIEAADAVIFSVIDTWQKQGFGIRTNIRYIIKSTATNEVLFERQCDLYLDLEQNSGGSGLLSGLIDLAASAIATAATDHIEAARKANYYIFKDIPRGKYSPDYNNDRGKSAELRNTHVTVK